MQVDLTTMIDIPEILLELGQQISVVTNQLSIIQNLTSNMELKVIPELLNTLNLTINRIKTTLSFFPDKRLNNRAERGLLNIVGIGLSYLFGLASEDDLDKINKRFITLDQLENNQNLMLEKLATQSSSHFTKINEIIVDINDIGKHLANISELMQIQFEIDYLMSYIHNIHKEIDSCMIDIKRHLDDVVLAAKGIVTTNIISLDDLAVVINTARTEHNLDPIFSSENLASYYSIITVLIAPKALILQIPMSSNYVFNHYRFTPFPTYNHNETIILKLNKTDLLISQDKKYYAEANQNQFSMCQHGENLLICPSNLLPLYSSLEQNTCLTTLLLRDSFPSGCHAMIMKSQTKVKIVEDMVFVTRPEASKARLSCPDGSRIITARTFAFKEDCTLEDKNLLIVGRSQVKYSVTHEGGYNFEIYQPRHLNHSTWKVIRPLEKKTEAFLLHSTAFYVAVPSTITIIALAILCILIYFLLQRRKKITDHNVGLNMPEQHIHVAI